MPLLLAALRPPAAQSLPVTSLPGFEGPLPSKQDAGYVTVDDSNGTRYFYWYVDSLSINPKPQAMVGSSIRLACAGNSCVS